MTNESSGRRLRTPLMLMSRPARTDGEPASDVPTSGPLPVWARALLAGLATGAGGWLLTCVPVLIGWLADRRGDLGSLVEVASHIWLVAHGGGQSIGNAHWTMLPLGLTLLLLVVVAQVLSRVLRRLGSEDGEPPSWGTLLQFSGAFIGAYVLVPLSVALALPSPGRVLRTAVGAMLLAVAGGVWGISRVAGSRMMALLPPWARVIPAATAVGVLTPLAGGAVALTASILLNRGRIAEIADQLEPDAVVLVQLIVAQLVFLPNLVVWAATWVLGSGFTVGAGTVVSPAATDLGLLPSIPVLGALPAEGAGDWLLSWALIGVMAGTLIGLVVLRRRPTARLDEAVGVGFLAAVLALGVLLLLAALSGGDIGAARLTGLGPRKIELLVIGSAVLVVPAATVGMVGGVIRHFRGGRSEAVEAGADANRANHGR